MQDKNVREVLEGAWDVIARSNGLAWATANAGRFMRLLDAEAWTSAAEMLIPTDGSMALLDIEYSYEPSQPGVWSACTIRWYPPHKSGNNWHAQIESGPIPAIALATAALKAKEQP